MSPKPVAASRLSKSAVIDGALRLADSAGLETLTIRRLAADLGVTPMALYWHFRGKDELLDGLADRLRGEIGAPLDPAVPWPAQLRTQLESLVVVLRAHPSAARLLQDHERLDKAALRMTEVALEILRGAGFGPQEASAIGRSVLWTGIMLVMSDPRGGLPPGKELEELQRVRQIRLATLPAASYPRLVEYAVPMTTFEDPEFHCELGISLFIAGVEALAARPARAP